MSAIPERRPPSPREWIIIGGVMALGVGLFILFVYSKLYGVTPEDRLVTVEGFPEDAEITGTSTLLFKVGSYPTEYGKDSPHYKEIVAAVRHGELLEISISTEKETWPRPGIMPLYRLSANGSPILLYAETADKLRDRDWAILGGALVAWALGAVGFVQAFRNLRASRREPRPESPSSERKKEIIGAVFLSVLLYALFIGAALSDSNSPSTIERAFGPRPFGLPVGAVVAAAITLLYIPAPWVFWHLMRQTFRAKELRASVERGDIGRAAELASDVVCSQWVVRGGIVYSFLLAGAWIVYTAIRGV
jgi:hypothetical protein